MKKKVLSVLLATVLLLACVPLSVSAEGVVNGLTYEIADGQVTITGYTADLPADVVIPATIEGYPVTKIGQSAFARSTLTSVSLPDSLVTIDLRAFSFCEGLAAITIPDSVTTIDTQAFAYTGLTYIVIPDSVTEVGRSTFMSCSNLTSVTLPKGLTCIASGMFEGTGLISVTIPDSVTEIGDYAFACCYGLTSVVISDSVTAIGEYAFGECENLTSLMLGNGLTVIGPGAFNYCPLLTSVTIPDSVTTLGMGAFASCYGLTSVVIPDSVTTLGTDAFYGCASLASVTIGAQVSSITGCFSDCPLLKEWHVSENNPYMTIQDGVVFSADKTELMYAIDPPEMYTIPEGVTVIGECAFQNCTELNSVTIPASVTEIGKHAFLNCTGLTAVHISDVAAWCGIDFKGGYASFCESNPLNYAGNLYLNGRRVTNLVIPEGVAKISQYAFFGCVTLTSVTIPASITEIGSYAFQNCTGLTAVHISDVAAWCSIGSDLDNRFGGLNAENLYLNGTLVTELVIPEGVTAIPGYAFYECTSLTSVTIPESVTSIGECAFRGCANLTTVNTPNSITTIERQAFWGCQSLTSFTVPDGVTSIPYYAFSNCQNLTTITIPASVTSVINGAFYGCTSLTDVYYGGIATDRKNITYGWDNGNLTNATWHYTDDPIGDEVQHSVMDTERGNGLAFRFEMTAKGVQVGNKHVADLTNATVNYLGEDCKLIAMGAVMTNDDAVGATAFTLDDANGRTVLNVPTVYLQEIDEEYCAFATRIINIPDSVLERTIYARPYYVVEVDGEQIVVYGDTDSASCAEYL